jgi:hypothetical protein
MRLKYCKFANSVLVGSQERTSVSNNQFDIDLVSETVIRVRCQKTKDVSYSSLFNVPWWKMDESELEKEAEGIPPAENLDIAQPKPKAPKPAKKAGAA